MYTDIVIVLSIVFFFFFPSFLGFSISIMKADETILQRLDAATKAPYWPVGVDGL
jgi:hypothetical protein